jgi:ribA/ribD-fused uncharacterized protein
MTNEINSFSGDYRWLSNFYPCLIEYEGKFYPSVEHAFQAAKTTDEHMRLRIGAAATPGRAKRLGRKVALRSDWDVVKLEVMATLVRIKFADPDLGKLLNDTGAAELIEGNTWGDTFWGVCRGVGENHLGKILMEVRRENRIFFLDNES